MVRYLILMLLVLMLSLSVGRADDTIVVITETPVAEFTLPNGSVLKNAFVWKRTFEGLMIVHDNGQYFLNFSTLPDDWKVAYFGEPEEEAPEEPEGPPVVLDDKYKLKAVLDVVPRLSDQGVEWLLREDATDAAKESSLAIALFHTLAGNNREKAKRYLLLIEERDLKIESVKVDKIFNECPICNGKGEAEQDCPDCKGSGDCAACDGKGLKKMGLGKSNQKCDVCEGSGDCPTCNGEKKYVGTCRKCRGRGQLLDQRYCEVNRDHLVRLANAAAEGKEAGPLTLDLATGVPQILEKLPDLDDEAKAFYLSEDYTGAMDTNILVACVMYSLLRDDLKEADRFNLMLEAQFPKNKLLKIGDYIKICPECKAKGFVVQECPDCGNQKEKGQCPECEGEGTGRSELRRKVECKACDGTGECAGCNGDGEAVLRCENCGGRGRIFESLRSEVKLEITIDDLNDSYKAYLKKLEEQAPDKGLPEFSTESG